MGDHDPQCTYGPEWDRMKGGARGCPECALIARVRAEYTDWVAPGQHDAVVATAEARARADERESIAARGTAAALRTMRREVEAEVREQTAQEISDAWDAAKEKWRSSGDAYWEGRMDALDLAERIARGGESDG